MIAVERYPSLMLLHLDANYPHFKWSAGKMKGLVSGEGGWTASSMLVAAWQPAGGALDVGGFCLFGF